LKPLAAAFIFLCRLAAMDLTRVIKLVNSI
jgi:hypothetical protein